MIDSIGSRTTRYVASLALALMIPLAVTATSSARSHHAKMPATTPPAARIFSELPFLLADRGIHPAGAFVPTGGKATAAGTPCGDTPGLFCSTVVVPLDRTGVVPGTVSLHV